MPNRFTQKTQKAEQKCVFGPSPREPCRAGSAAKTGVPQILRIHQVKTDRSQMHTDRDVIEHLSVTLTLQAKTNRFEVACESGGLSSGHSVHWFGKELCLLAPSPYRTSNIVPAIELPL